jgi:hypothetical protein
MSKDGGALGSALVIGGAAIVVGGLSVPVLSWLRGKVSGYVAPVGLALGGVALAAYARNNTLMGAGLALSAVGGYGIVSTWQASQQSLGYMTGAREAHPHLPLGPAPTMLSNQPVGASQLVGAPAPVPVPPAQPAATQAAPPPAAPPPMPATAPAPAPAAPVIMPPPPQPPSLRREVRVMDEVHRRPVVLSQGEAVSVLKQGKQQGQAMVYIEWSDGGKGWVTPDCIC